MGCLVLEANSWSLDEEGPDDDIPDLERIRDTIDQARLLLKRPQTAGGAYRILPRTWEDLTLAFGLPLLTTMQQNLLQSLVVAVRHIQTLPTTEQLDAIRGGVAHLAGGTPVSPLICVEFRRKLRASGCIVDELTVELADLSCVEVTDDDE